MIDVTGKVQRGLGLASKHIAGAADELEILIGERIVPGSLNVALDRPLMVKPSRALLFDGEQRLLWPALLNGRPVWLYRWANAPLHIAEILATSHLRSELSLNDGDEVKIQMNDDLVGPAPNIAWSLLWRGREDWVGSKRYYDFARKLGVQYGIGLQRFSLRDAMARLSRQIRRLPLPYAFRRIDGGSEQQKILNLLNYTKISDTSYSARHFPAGYHSIEFAGRKLRGQRDPSARLGLVPIDFAGKSVLDLGSNQGGMLLALSDQLRWGVGVDFDARMVNVANRVSRTTGAAQLDFYVFNLERESLELIKDFLPETRADVCFLLSVCMWLKNWREVIDFAASISDVILFESNGSDEQQDEQIAYLESVCSKLEMLASESADDPGQKARRLALAHI